MPHDVFLQANISHTPRSKIKTTSLRNVVDLKTDSIDPSLAPHKRWEVYSLPGFDNERQPEHLLGSDIGSTKYIVPDHCILFNKLNVRFRRVWKIDSISPDKICSTEFLPFVVKKGVSPEFVYHAIRSVAFTTHLAGVNTNTSGSHKRVDPDFVLDSPIPLPDLPTQLRIAGIIGRIMYLDRNHQTLSLPHSGLKWREFSFFAISRSRSAPRAFNSARRVLNPDIFSENSSAVIGTYSIFTSKY